jgi:hypothetical protein
LTSFVWKIGIGNTGVTVKTRVRSLIQALKRDRLLSSTTSLLLDHKKIPHSLLLLR